MKKGTLILIVFAFIYPTAMVWTLDWRIRQMDSQLAELRGLWQMNLAPEWKQDHESDLSTFLCAMMAEKIEVGNRRVGVITPQQRLDLCRWLLDFQAKQRFERRKAADPNSAWYPDSYMTAAIRIEEGIAEQSGLPFLKPFDPNRDVLSEAADCAEIADANATDEWRGGMKDILKDITVSYCRANRLTLDPNSAEIGEIKFVPAEKEPNEPSVFMTPEDQYAYQ